jgi:hypothetical protein
VRAGLRLAVRLAEGHADDSEGQNYGHASCRDRRPAHRLIVAFVAAVIQER